MGPLSKCTIEEAPELELKIVSSHLRYAFLGDNEALSIMLSVALSETRVCASLALLKRINKAIMWQMSDIHSITPSLCMYKIYIEEGHRPNVQHQKETKLGDERCGNEVIK